MAIRRAVNQLIIGHADNQRIISPGDEFDTDHFGVSDDELKKLDESGSVRVVETPKRQSVEPETVRRTTRRPPPPEDDEV